MKNLVIKGFSLIEILVALAILAIIAAIAMPSYNKYVWKSRRSEGLANLMKIQAAYEEYNAQNNAYPTANTLPPASSSPIPATPNYTYSSTTSTNTYTLKATAKGSQASDTQSGTSCKTLTINHTGNQTPLVCWQ